MSALGLGHQDKPLCPLTKLSRPTSSISLLLWFESNRAFGKHLKTAAGAYGGTSILQGRCERELESKASSCQGEDLVDGDIYLF
jgi:hypothetical protein